MKIKFIIFFYAFIYVDLFAQITISDADLVDVGDVIYQSYDLTPPPSISIGGSGINQIWDFSELQAMSNDTLFFIDPSSTPHSGLYLNVNFSMKKNGSISYFNKNNSGIYLHGIGDTVFNSPIIFYPLPLTYNLNITDGPTLAIDTVLTNPTLLSFIDSATVSNLTNGLADKVDTAVILTSYTSEFIVDASGLLTIPLGTFEVLRLKSIKYIITDLNIYCSNSINQYGSWIYNLPLSSIPILSGFSNNQVEYKFEWITDSPMVDFLLAEVVVDSLDNIIGGFSFQNMPTQSQTQDLISKSFKIYPIPSSYNITIESEDKNRIDFCLRDLNGKLILEDHFYYTTTLSLDGLLKGNYFLELKTKKGNCIKKVLVK